MISGTQKVEKSFNKYVGLFEGKVVAINPTVEEFAKEIQEDENWKPHEDSKLFNYLGESREGNKTVAIEFWIKDVNNKKIIENEEKARFFKLRFLLEDIIRYDKEGIKKQLINNVGMSTWEREDGSLPQWFESRPYRPAYTGEELLYNFLRIWLGKLDTRSKDTILELDWKKLMKGDVEAMRRQIDGEFDTTVGFLATVTASEKDDGTIVEYQNIYNSGFVFSNALKYFNLIDYTDIDVLNRLNSKEKPAAHERFVSKVTDPEYGCKDFYILKQLDDYENHRGDNITATNKVISSEDSPIY